MAAGAEAADAATRADAAAATVAGAPSVVCAAAPSVEDVYMAARSAHAEDAAVDVDAVDADGDGADAAAGESGAAAVCHGAAANPGANPASSTPHHGGGPAAIAKDRALCSTPLIRGHACR
jgi:hypothetical protein